MCYERARLKGVCYKRVLLKAVHHERVHLKESGEHHMKSSFQGCELSVSTRSERNSHTFHKKKKNASGSTEVMLLALILRQSSFSLSSVRFLTEPMNFPPSCRACSCLLLLKGFVPLDNANFHIKPLFYGTLYQSHSVIPTL